MGKKDRGFDPDTITRLEFAAQERDNAVHRFNVRRNLEWKLALALWTGLGLAAIAIADVQPLACGAKWAITGTAGAIVLLHLYWVIGYVVDSAKKDHAAGIEWALFIAETLDFPKPNKNPGEYNVFAAHFWPVLITGLVAALIVLTVWS